jgi:hypothetical protein
MPRPLQTTRALGALALLALAGCASLGASVDNLESLHPSEGRHAYVASIQNHMSWTMRNISATLLGRFGKDVQLAPAEPVEDPVETCVAELQKLASLDSNDPATGSTQVEFFARTAAYDPWCLSRETAVLELGRSAARLGFPATLPDIRTATLSASDASAALAALVAVAKPAFEQPSDEHRAAFEAECLRMARLPLDFDSGLKVIHGVNVLLRAASKRDARVEPLRPLALALQRRLVAQAVELALMDAVHSVVAGGSEPGWPNDRVQAAAVRAAVRIGGSVKLGELLTRNPFAGLGGERLVAALECVAELGLPDAPAKEGGAELRAQWAAAIYQTAVEHPDGHVRIAAMKALGTMSGRGLASLQEVEWQRWWQTEGAVQFRSAAPAEQVQGS